MIACLQASGLVALAVMSALGQKRTSERIGFAPFTGHACPALGRRNRGSGFVAAGNMLAGPQVLAGKASAFSARDASLLERSI